MAVSNKISIGNVSYVLQENTITIVFSNDMSEKIICSGDGPIFFCNTFSDLDARFLDRDWNNRDLTDSMIYNINNSLVKGVDVMIISLAGLDPGGISKVREFVVGKRHLWKTTVFIDYVVADAGIGFTIME